MSAASEDVLVLRSLPAKGVMLLRLNRPEKRNALSNELIAQLADQVRRAEQSKGCRVIVLSGGPECFSAGADIKEMRADGIAAIQNRRRAENWAVLETAGIPIIAAVSGPCYGGGHELAMLCDIVIASETATFGQPEIRLGHIPGDGATQRLPRRIGKYAAMWMILAGEPIKAEAALRLGLALEVVADAEGRALEVAAQIARHSARALGLAKDAVRASEELPLGAGLERERRNIALAFTSRDQKEGLAAFFEKREPDFNDE